MPFFQMLWMFLLLTPVILVWSDRFLPEKENKVPMVTILRPKNLSVVLNATHSKMAINTTAARIIRARMRRNWLRNVLNNGTSNEMSADDGDDNENEPDNDSEPLIIEDGSQLFEGDIRGIAPQAMKPQVGVQATATSFESDTWPDGEVPYQIVTDGHGRLEPSFVKLVQRKMSIISHVSCVKFKKRREEKDYLHIVAGGGICNSYVGVRGGQQILQYDQSGCNSERKILHELLHALGFYHEMAREDRDKYIKVIQENVKPSLGYNFEMYQPNVHGLPFDFDSVMMYESTDFAKDKRRKTIEVIGDPKRQLGKAKSLTNMDIFTLNDLYKCTVPDCEDRENGKFGFNYKCYYMSSSCVAYAQAEESCKTNGGKLAQIPQELVGVFFKAVKKEDAIFDIYWIAPEPAPASNDNDAEEELSTDEDDTQCTGIISGDIKKMPCEYCSNVICEVQP